MMPRKKENERRQVREGARQMHNQMVEKWEKQRQEAAERLCNVCIAARQVLYTSCTRYK